MTNQSDTRGSETSAAISAIANIVAGIFLAAMAVTVLMWLVPYNTQASNTVHDIQPGFFPSLAAWVVLGLSIALVGTNLWHRRETASSLKGSAILLEITVWAVVATLTMAGLMTVGFLFVAPILIFAGMIFAGYRNWPVIILLSVLLPVVVDQAAWIFFTVQLP